MPAKAAAADGAQVRPAVGDPSKLDSMWKQRILMEHSLYSSRPLPGLRRRRAPEGLEWAQPRPPSSRGAAQALRASSAPTLGGSLDGLDFLPGDIVKIKGMSRRKDLNGLHGTVMEGDPDDSGRVCVKLRPNTSSGTAKVVRVKSSRLQQPPRQLEPPREQWRLHRLPTSAGRLFVSGDVGDLDSDVDHFRMNDKGRDSMEFKILEQRVTGQRANPGPEQVLHGHRGFARLPCGSFYYGQGRVHLV
mmetsp:Transcript_45395/g.82976  ORF Transcript_45395/g.82976 Transcript_45395/m.82976 type:complete len:246 (+) Transcript_45395:124-861(+)